MTRILCDVNNAHEKKQYLQLLQIPRRAHRIPEDPLHIEHPMCVHKVIFYNRCTHTSNALCHIKSQQLQQQSSIAHRSAQNS